MDELGLINYYEEIDSEETDVNTSIIQENYHNNIDILSNYEQIRKNNKTPAKLTKYEKTKILGIRGEMLSMGAKPLVIFPKHVTRVEDIARIELKERKIPFIIRRKVTDGYDYWKLEDLSY